MFLTRWIRSRRSAARAPRKAVRQSARGRAPSVEALEDRCLLSATLVRDILTDTDSSLPTNLVAVGSTLFFAAESGLTGRELWKYDTETGAASLVKDINPGRGGSIHIAATNVNGVLFFGAANVNGVLFFAADDGVHGQELWRSDGTEAGTVMVKDIRPGGADSHALLTGFAPLMINVGGTLFFTATDATSGQELWKSDGTEAGTVLVREIAPGINSPLIRDLTNVNGTLFFTARDVVDNREVWKSDGTAAGTVVVKEIRPGPIKSDPNFLVNVNGVLFFAANDGVHNQELWKSDGTEAGTVLVKDIFPDSLGSSPANLTNVNGTLFFQAKHPVGTNNRELFRSDGTEAGTLLVKDIWPGTVGSSPANLVNVNGALFFTANDGVTGTEVWRSDGTEAGTVLVRDIRPGSASPFSILIDSGQSPTLTNANGTLLFRANDGATGLELWRSDGTTAGTVLVKDINPTGERGGHGFPRVTNTSVFLTPWFTPLGGVTYFAAFNPLDGVELWQTDATEAGTVLAADVNLVTRDTRDGVPGTLPRDANPSRMIDVNGTLFFVAGNGYRDGLHGRELYKSDGTQAGTFLVKDINPGPADSGINWLTVANGILYFLANDGVHGAELWRSDGTAAGTFMVRDINPGSASGAPNLMVNVNGILLFSATDGVSGFELWKSDGTEAGTVLVRDINPGSAPSIPRELVNVNGTLFFHANDGVNGRELWKSDGTAAGTVLVRDIGPGVAGGFLENEVSFGNLTNVNGTLFFVANDGATGFELWKSDGTVAGTVLVKDIRPGSAGAFTRFTSDGALPSLTAVGGTLFFVAANGITVGANGYELWKSDGTAEGTVMVRDIYPGLNSSAPRNLTEVNGILFFTASFFMAPDGHNGEELWKSDGTEAGTVLVKDIRPGRDSAFVTPPPIPPETLAAGRPLQAELTNAGGRLYFVANDGSHGVELWTSDGTEAGTVLVQDLNPGSANGVPVNPIPAALSGFLAGSGGRLFFTGNDGLSGLELWAVPLAAGVAPVIGPIADQTVSEGSLLTFTVTATDRDTGESLTFSLVSGPAGASIDPVTGVFTWTPDDGPNAVTVTVRVTDSGGLSDTRSFTVTVLNVAPAAGVSGPTSGTPGQTLSFTLTATDPSSADQVAGFTYVIDWGDGSPLQTISAFPGSGSGVVVSHAYAAAGAYVVRVTAIDKDGGAGTAMLIEPVMIASAPGMSDLSWSGGGILAPPPVAAGQSFTISRTFAVGGEAVGPFTIAYWASVDDIFGNEDDFLVGVELIAGAAPGIHSGTSPAFTIGAPGSYFLFAVLDSDGQINEIDETNNVAMALFPLLVSELADDEEETK